MATATLTQPAQSIKPKPQADSLRWLVLVTVIVGTFLGRLDQTIVNLALPNIINDFHITVSQAGWIGTAYILANAVFVPIWGMLGDTIGRKRVYIIGFVIFIIGSILAGLSWNLPSMLVFRVIQAIAGSADYPTGHGHPRGDLPGAQEPRASAGHLVERVRRGGGLRAAYSAAPLIDHFNWRAVFLINLPVGLIGLFMALAS